MAYKKAFTKKNIDSGWAKTGLYPFKPEVVLDKFLLKEVAIEERPLSSKSFKLLLTATDWKKIEKKLKEVVTNIYNVKVKQLTKTITTLAATNIIFELHIQGYQQALKNEQKKRQHQKPLFHQFTA